jgi:hypothetical protein
MKNDFIDEYTKRKGPPKNRTPSYPTTPDRGVTIGISIDEVMAATATS